MSVMEILTSSFLVPAITRNIVKTVKITFKHF